MSYVDNSCMLSCFTSCCSMCCSSICISGAKDQADLALELCKKTVGMSSEFEYSSYRGHYLPQVATFLKAGIAQASSHDEAYELVIRFLRRAGPDLKKGEECLFPSGWYWFYRRNSHYKELDFISDILFDELKRLRDAGHTKAKETFEATVKEMQSSQEFSKASAESAAKERKRIIDLNAKPDVIAKREAYEKALEVQNRLQEELTKVKDAARRAALFKAGEEIQHYGKQMTSEYAFSSEDKQKIASAQQAVDKAEAETERLKNIFNAAFL